MDERIDGEFISHIPCPYCGSSDAGSLYDNGQFHCFSCNAHEFDFEHSNKGQKKKRGKRMAKLVEVEYKALKNRGIDKDIAVKYGYGYSTYRKERVHVCNYRKNGEVVSQHLRNKNKEFKWINFQKGLELYGQHLFRNKGGKRVFITEGEIDCLSIAQAFTGWACVSLTSGVQGAKKDIMNNLAFLDSYDEIILAFDSDAPGRKGVEEVVPLFSAGKVKVIDWSPYKDANECLLAEGEKAVVKKIFEAKEFRPDGIIAGEDVKDKLIDFYHNGETWGKPLIYPKLNEMLHGIFKKKLYTFTAGSGVGKSTIVAEIAYDLLMNHKQKIGYIALEESVTETSLRMMSLYLNKRLHLGLEDVDEQEYLEAYNETVGNGRFFMYDHFGSLDSQTLLSRIKYLALVCGCDFIIFDHISIAVASNNADERKVIDTLMDVMRSTVEQTGVGLLLVSHLRKKSGDTKSHEEGGKVKHSDLRGSNSILQWSDVLVALERDIEKNNSKVKVLKNRVTGKTGYCDDLKYVEETGRMEINEGEEEQWSESEQDF